MEWGKTVFGLTMLQPNAKYHCKVCWPFIMDSQRGGAKYQWKVTSAKRRELQENATLFWNIVQICIDQSLVETLCLFSIVAFSWSSQDAQVSQHSPPSSLPSPLRSWRHTHPNLHWYNWSFSSYLSSSMNLLSLSSLGGGGGVLYTHTGISDSKNRLVRHWKVPHCI